MPTTLLDFEGFNPGPLPQNTFQAKHLVFDSRVEIRRDIPKPHSGRNSIAVVAAEFAQDFLQLRFTTRQKRVRLFAGCLNPPSDHVMGQLIARNDAGIAIAASNIKPVASDSCATLFEVRTPSNAIRRVDLITISHNAPDSIVNQICDDIEFEADPFVVTTPVQQSLINVDLTTYYGLALRPAEDNFQPVSPNLIPASGDARDVLLNLLAYDIAGLMSDASARDLKDAALKSASAIISRLQNKADEASKVGKRRPKPGKS